MHAGMASKPLRRLDPPGLITGTAGLFFDSLLGATLERRGWIGNNLVNLASTAFAAALTLPIIHYV